MLLKAPASFAAASHKLEGRCATGKQHDGV